MLTNTLTYRSAAAINEAMSRVYGHMFLALALSTAVSVLVAGSPAAMAFFFTGIMKWITIFAPLVAVFAVGWVLAGNPTRSVALALLLGFAALMGLSLAAVFAVYTSMSVFTAFMGAAILFGVLSFYGYFTKKNLEGLGKFMMVGLIAIIIASVINVFVGSTVTQMVISALAIVIFLGLTAWDTQRIREELQVESAGSVAEIRGALTLYLNFINIWISMVQLFGDQKD